MYKKLFFILFTFINAVNSMDQDQKGILTQLPALFGPTPKEYYDYDYHNLSFLLEKWEKQKKDITNAIAKANQDSELIKKIVNQPEFGGQTGPTPLCRAINMNDLPFTQFLLDHGAEVNGVIRGVDSSRPIFFAETLEMVLLLEKNGADMSAYNQGAGTAAGMNLLHVRLHRGIFVIKDDRLIFYLRSKENLKDESIVPACCANRLAIHIEKEKDGIEKWISDILRLKQELLSTKKGSYKIPIQENKKQFFQFRIQNYRNFLCVGGGIAVIMLFLANRMEWSK